MTTEHIRRLVSQATDRLSADLEAGKSDQLRAYLAALGRFRRYSLGNTLLIWTQRPTATRVAGFHTWRQLGRQVRKGERAIRILAPIVRRQATQDPEDEEDKVVAFRWAYVFDLAQTHGQPLPAFASTKGDPGDYQIRLCAFLKSRGILVELSRLPGSVQGMSAGGKITVRDDLTPAEEFSTTVHEAAHELMHRAAEGKKLPKGIREIEAEGVAYAVSTALGLDCNTASCDYILLYQGDKGALMASLERIHSVAGTIIEAVLSEEASSRPAVGQEPAPLASVAVTVHDFLSA